MKYLLDFLPEVEDDVAAAYSWYEEQLIGLGDDLLLNIDAVLNAITRKPELYAVVYKKVRKANIKRFPFGIFYMINANVVTVIAIVHLSRKPNFWKKRRK